MATDPDPVRESGAQATYAVIHVRSKGWPTTDAWPIVERVPGGWQSGVHHYPDADVLDVTPLALAGPGEVVVRLPAPRVVSGCDCKLPCDDDPDDTYAVFGGQVDVPAGIQEVWPTDEASVNGPWAPDEAKSYGLALLAAARWCATSPAEPTEHPAGGAA